MARALALLLLVSPAFAQRRTAPVRTGPAPVVLPGLDGLKLPHLPTVPADSILPGIVFDGSIRRDGTVPEIPAVTASSPESGKPSDPAPLAPSAPQAAPGPAATPSPRPPDTLPPAGANAVSFWRQAAPSVVTALNLTSGLGAILAAASGSLVLAGALILLANVFDGLDGRVARALGVSSDLGVELDSLADVVSFGAAPAALAWYAGLSALGPVGFVAAAGFAAAGAFRLARFNSRALAETHGRVPPEPGDYFTGMPIPGGAGVIVGAVLAAPLLGAAAPAVLAAVAVATAAAMASTLPYPAFKKGGARALLAPAAVILAVGGGLLALGAPILIPAAIFGVFLVTGPAIWLWNGGSEDFKREAKRKAFHQLTLLSIPAFLAVPADWRLTAAVAATAFVGAIELARLHLPAARPLFHKLFGGIIRAKESDRFSGSFYACLGMLVTVALFGRDVPAALGGFFAMGLADAASPLVGLRFGVGRFKVAGTQRSVDGALAGFGVATLIALALGFSLPVALLAALVFSAVDIYPVKPDDNLWIPVAFAGALHLIPLLF